MYRLPVYGHMAAKVHHAPRQFLRKRRKWDSGRTDLRSVHGLVVLERIKIVLDIDRRTFLDGPSTKERIRRL
jgi:hypothetical protein